VLGDARPVRRALPVRPGADAACRGAAAGLRAARFRGRAVGAVHERRGEEGADGGDGAARVRGGRAVNARIPTWIGILVLLVLVSFPVVCLGCVFPVEAMFYLGVG